MLDDQQRPETSAEQPDDTPVDFRSAYTDIRAAIRGVDHLDCSDDTRMEMLADLAGIRAAVDAAEAQILAILERSCATVIQTGHTTPRWLSNHTGVSYGAAKTRVKVARQLHDHFDSVFDALNEGRISFAHAQAIVDAANPRIHDDIVAIQNQLVAIAENSERFERFNRELRSITNLLDQDGAFDPNAELQANRLSFRFDPDGVRIDGLLVGASAASVKATIERIADERFRRQNPDEPSLTRPQLMAAALVELCRRGSANGTTGRAPQADITLIINADQPDQATTLDGTVIAGGTLDQHCCDANFTPVTVDGDGQPLNVGRTRRLATEPQRRAVMVRDGGCVFPGCAIPVNWCDLHHVQHWRNGGATDVANLANLCRRHHGLTHSNGWHMAPTEMPGHFKWTTPTGQTLHSQHHPPGG